MQLIERIIVPPRNGKAFEVKNGQILRVVLPDGPQVVDFDVFNRHNPRERFESTLTRQRSGAHPTTGARLYSNHPWASVMFEITLDTVHHEPHPTGAVSHDLLGGRCSRLSRIENYGSDTPGCQENMAGAIAEYGLAPEDVHNPFNMFMKTGVEPNGTYFIVEPDAVAGDYVELRAAMDCLVAVSICPGRSSGPQPHPVWFEIYNP